VAISQVRQARSLTPSLPPPKTPADHASARVPAPGDGFEQRTADVGSLGFAEPMLSRSCGGYVHRAQPQRMTENLEHSQWSATSARGVCIFVTKKRHMLRREWRTECSNRPTRWPPPPPKAEVGARTYCRAQPYRDRSPDDGRGPAQDNFAEAARRISVWSAAILLSRLTERCHAVEPKNCPASTWLTPISTRRAAVPASDDGHAGP